MPAVSGTPCSPRTGAERPRTGPPFPTWVQANANAMIVPARRSDRAMCETICILRSIGKSNCMLFQARRHVIASSVNAKYRAAWRAYARWRFALWAGLGTLMSIGWLGAQLNERWKSLPSVIQWLVLTAFVFSAAIFMISGVRLRLFRCPRCGNWFSIERKRLRLIGHFPTRCVHCGLRKWSVDDSSSSVSRQS